MRTNIIVEIDENKTKEFFSNRAKKYSKDNPYAVTMYQDNNPALVTQRNKAEIEKLLPKMQLNSESQLLDIGCGIGRWADALIDNNIEIKRYCGIDFSEELVEIAKERNQQYHKLEFYKGGITEINGLFSKGTFNRVIMMGVSIYLNDRSFDDGLTQIADICGEKSILVFREPVGLGKRLTLRDYYSEDLKADYNAIYRTIDEIMLFFEKNLLKNGFKMVEYAPLFRDDLNNRKETMQYYFIFTRE